MNEPKKTIAERLAEEMAKVPDDQKETVAALLIGVCHGVQLAAQAVIDGAKGVIK